MAHHYLGTFEELVLLAILGLGDEAAYAVAIHARVVARTERATTLGNVYRTLSRLEKKGYIRSWMGAITHERGGKRKRLYACTGTGEAALLITRDARARMA